MLKMISQNLHDCYMSMEPLEWNRINSKDKEYGLCHIRSASRFPGYEYLIFLSAQENRITLSYLNPAKINLCVQMNSSILFDTLNFGWFIVHSKGSQVRISKLGCNSVPGDYFYTCALVLKTGGLRGRASPTSLRCVTTCVLEQDTLILA